MKHHPPMIYADRVGTKVCNTIKNWRESSGKPQHAVAGIIGTTRQTLSEFEKGDPNKLSLRQFLALCRLMEEEPQLVLWYEDAEQIEAAKQERERKKDAINRAMMQIEATLDALMEITKEV